jgi:hypothetical protein
MKTCSRCGLPKPLEEFYKDATKKEGRKNICIPCTNLRDCKYTANYRRTHRESVNAYNARRQKTAKGRANQFVNRGLFAGRITKPECCSACGALTPSRQLHAHHPNYEKPYEFVWVCKTCHGLRHRKYQTVDALMGTQAPARSLSEVSA